MVTVMTEPFFISSEINDFRYTVIFPFVSFALTALVSTLPSRYNSSFVNPCDDSEPPGSRMNSITFALYLAFILHPLEYYVV